MSMDLNLYLRDGYCISPQHSFGETDLETLCDAVNNKLQVIEPAYTDIPTGILRRMGRAIRFGVGTSLPLLKNYRDAINGVLIGTSNGGMEDCIKFLNQIVKYEEGKLTPTNFVQSTTNAIAAQIAMLPPNRGYNTTHAHRGLAFENALLDAAMLLQETPGNKYLVGGVDEISAYNYNIDFLDGWYKKEAVSAKDVYESGSTGALAGEGSAMFLVTDRKEEAVLRIKSIKMLHTDDAARVREQTSAFLQKQLSPDENIDLFLSGENGDSRYDHFYQGVSDLLNGSPIARFKHMMGEYPTASAAGLWLAMHILRSGKIPNHMLKNPAHKPSSLRTILIYNQHKEVQHSWMLVEKV